MITLLTALVLVPAPQDATAPVPPRPPDGFRALFDGRDLAGFWGRGTEDPATLHAMSDGERRAAVEASLPDLRAHWRVDNGELVNDGGGLYLTTLAEFGDFELLVDYATVAGADSGIYLRGIPQVQIWDTSKAGGKWALGADKGSGGLWNNSPGEPGKDPLVHADRPFGRWNHFGIRIIGRYVTVYLNDRLVVADAPLENYFDRSRPVPRRGPIQLQTHGGEIRWRNLFVREIGTAEANDYLRSLAGTGFETVFDGADLGGWRGATDGYQVVDGALCCKAGHGGTLFTEREYGDFVAELEIALPPGGNNGLAIRYPGEGDTAYVGMCELQVLDNSSPRYARLDPRQYHGSAYGMVAARRGYQRPVGEWNFETVTVRGSTVRVELNGFPILDADLATVTDYMAGHPHPGKDRRRGSFGFAGHNDPVRFRRVRIADLDTGAASFGPWRTLFDGRDLVGWSPRGQAAFTVEDGTIAWRGNAAAVLCTEHRYGDYELQLKVRLEGGARAGVLVCSPDDPKAGGPRIAIEPSPGDAGQVEATGHGWLGAAADRENPARRALYRNGAWNHYRVRRVGPRIRTWLNDVPVADVVDPAGPGRGRIGLQMCGAPGAAAPGRVRWRNLLVRELDRR